MKSSQEFSTIKYFIDDTLEQVFRLEKLFEEIHKEEKNKPE